MFKISYIWSQLYTLHVLVEIMVKNVFSNGMHLIHYTINVSCFCVCGHGWILQQLDKTFPCSCVLLFII